MRVSPRRRPSARISASTARATPRRWAVGAVRMDLTSPWPGPTSVRPSSAIRMASSLGMPVGWGRSGPDGGGDAVGEDLRWVGKWPREPGGVTGGRPRDRAGVENVVGGIPLALEHRRARDPGGGEGLETLGAPDLRLLARRDRSA